MGRRQERWRLRVRQRMLIRLDRIWSTKAGGTLLLFRRHSPAPTAEDDAELQEIRRRIREQISEDTDAGKTPVPASL